MVNFLNLENEINQFRDSFIEKLRIEATKLKEQIREQVKRELRRHDEEQLRKLEKMKLSKANANLFLRYVKLIEEIERTGKASDKNEETELFELMVRHYKIVKKFKEVKGTLVDYL